MPNQAGKKLWKGIFAYRSGVERLYAYAHSKEQARLVMCKRLAKNHGVHPSVVMGLFPLGGDNSEIKIETEFTEV